MPLSPTQDSTCTQQLGAVFNTCALTWAGRRHLRSGTLVRSHCVSSFMGRCDGVVPSLLPAFQELLTAQHAEARKGFRLLHSPAPSTLHLLSRVLPPLTSHCRALCSAPAATDPCTRPLVAQHLSGLLLSSWLLTALCASLDCATSHLRRAAACTLPGGSTAAAARLWLEDGAKTSEAGAGAEGDVRLVASPLLSFPPSSVLHTFEAGSMERLAQLHAARQRLEVGSRANCSLCHPLPLPPPTGRALCRPWARQSATSGGHSALGCCGKPFPPTSDGRLWGRVRGLCLVCPLLSLVPPP